LRCTSGLSEVAPFADSFSRMPASGVQVEPTAKRIRTWVAGELLLDTTNALLVWEKPYYPEYYLPRSDVRTELLVPSDRTERSPTLGDARYYTIDIRPNSTERPGRVVPDAVWGYPDSPIEAIRDHLRIEWTATDHWFEEDEEVYVHPRSPHARVDTLPSSRRVQVVVDGVTVADTHRPTLLFETGLPTRYYIPLTDVRQDLLEPSDTKTGCPHKGTASYYSVVVGGRRHDDLVWYYPTPLPESIRIAGMVCFYNDRVDLLVDGEPDPAS
jgi:uncharacterized protein (DUF427 family)